MTYLKRFFACLFLLCATGGVSAAPGSVQLGPATIPGATAMVPFSFDFKPFFSVEGEAAPDIRQVIWYAGGVPYGMGFHNGVLSGTPVRPATLTLGINATYKGQSSWREFTFNISRDATVLRLNLPPRTLAKAVQFKPYEPVQFSKWLSVEGANPAPSQIVWSQVGTLPQGLSFDPGTGALSGTATQFTSSAGVNFTVRASYQGVQAQQTYNIAVNQGVAMTLADASLPKGKLETAYVYDFKPLLTVTGASPTANQISWSTVGALPPGLSFNPTTAVLSGTPTQNTSAAGTSLTVKAGYLSNSAQKTYNLVVDTGLTVVLSPAALTRAKVATAYSFDFNSLLTVTGASPAPGDVEWSLVGAVPSGLVFNSDNGILSGTPTQMTAAAGSEITVQASYQGVASEETFTIFVDEQALSLKSLSQGGYYTCGVTPSGAAKCWGINSTGHLGDGTYTSKSVPVTVSGLGSNVAEISAGVSHACALMTNGTARCWGDNGNGQLGDGSTISRSTPVVVNGGAIYTKIKAGGNQTCAVTAGGAAFCWGYNALAQLGNGTTTSSGTPTQVTGLSSGVVDLVIGQYHACALLNTGGVRCWGYNANGQLGNGTTVTATTPITPTGMASGVAQISLHPRSSLGCARFANGSVKCWGFNTNGQVGNGTTSSGVLTPVQVTGLTSGVVQVTAGTGYACALLNTGAAKCWGKNDTGQLGTGSKNTQSTTPQSVSVMPSGIAGMHLGVDHTCALTALQTARCWGSGAYGQLGSGSTANSLVPVTVK